jgi:hypothetical protein
MGVGCWFGVELFALVGLLAANGRVKHRSRWRRDAVGCGGARSLRLVSKGVLRACALAAGSDRLWSMKHRADVWRIDEMGRGGFLQKGTCGGLQAGFYFSRPVTLVCRSSTAAISKPG